METLLSLVEKTRGNQVRAHVSILVSWVVCVCVLSMLCFLKTCFGIKYLKIRDFNPQVLQETEMACLHWLISPDNTQLGGRSEGLPWKGSMPPGPHQAGPFHHVTCLGLQASELRCCCREQVLYPRSSST